MTRRRCLVLGVLTLVVVVLSAVLGVVEGRAATSGDDRPEGPEPQRTREIVEQRTVNSKTYELDTGQRECVVYGEAVHYKDKAGAWREIDNRLIAEEKRIGGVDYVYRNGVNGYLVRFGAKSGGPALVRIEHKGKSLAFAPVGAKASQCSRIAGNGGRALEGMAVGENCVNYSGAYPGVDLVYEPTGNGVREYLVLKHAGAQNEFVFDLKLDGVEAVEEEGCLTFLDENGERIFWLGQPMAADEGLVSTGAVTYELSGRGKKKRLTLTLSRDYLEDPDRRFPVVIDPDIYVSGGSILDTYVDSLQPNTPNPYDDPWLRTGYCSTSGARRSLIKFNLDSAGVNIHPDLVDYCYLLIQQCYGTNPNIRAYACAEPWSVHSVTWNTQPGCTEASSSKNYWAGTGWWWKLYHTTPIKKWLSGEWPNYGWIIKDSTEWPTSPEHASWYYSSNSPSPHKPELHIVYHYEQVDVKLACDGLYRSAVGSSWRTLAYNALERIDDQMARRFGINLNVKTVVPWYSLMDGCGYDHCIYDHELVVSPYEIYHYWHMCPWRMLDDAIGDLGTSDADLLVAVTGTPYMRTWDAERHVAGNIYYGLADYEAECICCHDAADYELWHIMQHEVCHLYGALDHSYPTRCVMYHTDTEIPYPDEWCAQCEAVIQDHVLDH